MAFVVEEPDEGAAGSVDPAAAVLAAVGLDFLLPPEKKAARVFCPFGRGLLPPAMFVLDGIPWLGCGLGCRICVGLAGGAGVVSNEQEGAAAAASKQFRYNFQYTILYDLFFSTIRAEASSQYRYIHLRVCGNHVLDLHILN